MRSFRNWHTATALGLVVVLTVTARADVAPASIFTDHAVLQRDRPIIIWGTAEPGEQVRASLSNDSRASGSTQAAADGRFKLEIPPQPAGGPYTLTIQGKNKVELRDVLIGEVWICSGQSNMEWPLRSSFAPEKAIAEAANPKLRLFTVTRSTALEPQRSVKGSWQECTPQSVESFTAVGYYFGRDLQKALGVPVGLIHTSWGGTPAQAWASKGSLNSEPKLRYYHEQLEKSLSPQARDAAKSAYEAALKKYEDALAKHKEAVAKAKEEGKKPPQAPRKPQFTEAGRGPGNPSVLYNAMIAPLVPYGIRGAIWYQGESNAGKAYEYQTLFPLMIQDWRQQWKQGDFPFLCVQLAPFKKIESQPTESDWAELREAQLLATKKLPAVGMAVITDVGEENDIHPRKKEPVGARLSLLARKLAYGQDITAMGPVYKKMHAEGNQVTLSFDNLGAGLECHGSKLTGFTVAGSDRKFHPADAQIRGDTVVVTSPEVEKPVAVRFGWTNYPVVNLWNKDGLPATPFRTDDWPGVTQDKTAQPKAGRGK